MSDLAHTAVSTVSLHVRGRMLIWLAAAVALAAIAIVLVVTLPGGSSTSSSRSQSVAAPSQSGPERSTLDRFGASAQESGPEQAAIGRSPVFPTSVPVNHDNGPEQASFDRGAASLNHDDLRRLDSGTARGLRPARRRA